MQTKSQTTYILLERGVEDKALWYELNSIIAALKVKSIKEFIVKYPLLNELKHNLKIELDSQDEIQPANAADTEGEGSGVICDNGEAGCAVCGIDCCR